MERCLYCYYYDKWTQSCCFYGFDDPYDPDEVQPECCKDDPCYDFDSDFEL